MQLAVGLCECQLRTYAAPAHAFSRCARAAYGAHLFNPKDSYYVGVYERANHYHLMHSALLALAPIAR